MARLDSPPELSEPTLPSGAPSVDLDSLRLFADAARLGSLSRAAEAMGLALAGVSRRIAALERHYGAPLLVRTGRGVVPTGAGLALLAKADAIFDAVSLAHTSVARSAARPSDEVQLAASPSALCHTLPEDLARFRQERPGCRLDIRELETGAAARAVRNGQVDVAVVVADPLTAGLRTSPYRTDELVVVAAAGRSGLRSGLRLADLVNEPLVILGDDTALVRLLRASAAAAGLKLRIAARAQGFAAACRLAQAGIGVSILPRPWIHPLAAALDLDVLALDEPWGVRELVICTHPDRAEPAAVRHLRRTLSSSALSDG